MKLKPTAVEWIKQIFQAQQVAKGGVVRRKKPDVESYASMSQLITEVKRRGFHLVEVGDQLVIFCNKGVLKIHC